MEASLKIEDFSSLPQVLGVYDGNLRTIEKHFGVKIFVEDSVISIQGTSKKVSKARDFIAGLLGETGQALTSEKVKEALFSPDTSTGSHSEKITLSSRRKNIIVSSPGQKKYLAAMQGKDMVFCIGPAGSGKTYLAMAMAVNMLNSRKVNRIILTRPALEAGESLGYLPGTIRDKFNPYLKPLSDALYDLLEPGLIRKYFEENIIEIVPIAYMRGRTLNNAFIVLDEAQNCTSEQLKMFITRLGFYSRAVIAGDITQSDLPRGKPNGLLSALRVVKTIPEIAIVELSEEDILRHSLVKKIIKAYDKIEKK